MTSVSVKQLKIKVDTNITSNQFDLTFSKIHNSIPVSFLRKANISEYPFFTPDVEYQDSLHSKLYKDILYIFFDKQEFIRVIVNNEDKPVKPTARPNNPAEKMRIAEKNVMTMLKLLFPINYPVKNNLNTSYNKYLIKKGPDIQIDIEDVTSFVYSGNLNPGKPKYSYLKTEKGVCTVSEVIWLNDILNNKLYRDLVNELIKYTEWVKTQHTTIDAEISTITTQLQTDLQSTGKLYIGSEEIAQLQSEKRIYNPDDIKEDIKKIILEYVVVDKDTVKNRIFYEELDKMVDFFLQTHILNKQPQPISQFTRFKDKFDFKYSNKQSDNLFFLHKRYNNEDIVKKNDKDTKDIKDKTEDIDEIQKKLDESKAIVENLMKEDGYTEILNETKKTFVFTAPMLKKYVKILEELREECQDYNDDSNTTSYTTTNGITLTNDSTSYTTHITNKIQTVIDFSSNKLNNGAYPYIDGNIIIDDDSISNYKFLNDDNLLNTTAIVVKIYNFSKYNNAKKLTTLNANAIKGLSSQIALVAQRITELEEKLKVETDKINTYNSEIEKKNNEIKALTISRDTTPNREIFVLKPPDTDTQPKLSLADLKTDLATQITEMQEKIFKGVIIKYNRFKEISKTTELIGRYAEIDSSVDTMVDEINKLNNLSNTKSSQPTQFVNDILNITEKIKSIFDKLTTSKQINIARTFGEKIAKILQLSNQIQILNALETQFFPKTPTGIFVNYEKDLDKTATITEKLLKEIALSRYSNFIEMVAFIKKDFLQNEVESLNVELNNLLNNYFANKNNDFYQKIVLPASEVINRTQKAKMSYDENWNVSITTLKSSTSKGEQEYQISLYMELIEGELNEQNQSGITCQFLDEELTRRFEALIDNDSSFEHTRNSQVFNIKDAQTKIEKKKQESLAEIKKIKSALVKPPEEPPKATTGGTVKRNNKKTNNRITKRRL